VHATAPGASLPAGLRWRRPGKLVEVGDQPEREEIAARGELIILARGLLGRHVRRRPDRGADARAAGIVDFDRVRHAIGVSLDAADAPAHHVHFIARPDHDVVGLDWPTPIL